MEILEYLEKNQNIQERKHDAHEKILDRIIVSPTLIDLPFNSTFYREVQFPGGRNAGCVDLVATDQNILYLIEAKAIYTDSPKRASKVRASLNEQLKRAYHAFLNEFDIASHKVSVYKFPGSDDLIHHHKSIPITDQDKIFIH